MAKVWYPLFSGEVRGSFGNKFIYRRGGVVTKYFVPRDPKSAAQLEVRRLFLENYVSGLTKEQADLLYAAILHLHEGQYAELSHLHDHGSLEGLGDDDHTQYLTPGRADLLYSVLVHAHGGLYSVLGHLHDASYSALSHNHSSLYSVLAHLHDGNYSALSHNHSALYSALAHLHAADYAALSHNHNSAYSLLGHTHLYRDVYAAHAAGGTIAAGATMYLCPFVYGLIAANNAIGYPFPGTATKCFLRVAGTQPASGSLACTMQKNGADSAITFTVPAGGTTGEFSDLTHTVALAAGDRVGWKLVNNASAASIVIGYVTLGIEGTTN